MRKKPRYRSDAFEAIHESAQALHALGVIDKKVMRDFDDAALQVPAMSTGQIKKIRGKKAPQLSDVRDTPNSSESTPIMLTALCLRIAKVEGCPDGPRARPNSIRRKFAMPSKTKAPGKVQLKTLEVKRDLSAELLQSVREMKAGKVQVVFSPSAKAERKNKST